MADDLGRNFARNRLVFGQDRLFDLFLYLDPLDASPLPL